MNGIMVRNNKKPMTIDRLAVTIETLSCAIRNDFAEVRADLAGLRENIDDIRAKMATKQDIADLRDEMIARFATHSEFQSAIGTMKDELLEEIGKIKYAKEIDDLRSRMNRVEHELGIGRGGSLA
jgi:DNA gyrase/topoisomerase IV subunit A